MFGEKWAVKFLPRTQLQANTKARKNIRNFMLTNGSWWRDWTHSPKIFSFTSRLIKFWIGPWDDLKRIFQVFFHRCHKRLTKQRWEFYLPFFVFYQQLVSHKETSFLLFSKFLDTTVSIEIISKLSKSRNSLNLFNSKRLRRNQNLLLIKPETELDWSAFNLPLLRNELTGA